MNSSFTDDGFGFVLEVGPLTPVEGDGPSCLGRQNKHTHTHTEVHVQSCHGDTVLAAVLLACTKEAMAPSYRTICSVSTKLAAWPPESMPATHNRSRQVTPGHARSRQVTPGHTRPLTSLFLYASC